MPRVLLKTGAVALLEPKSTRERYPCLEKGQHPKSAVLWRMAGHVAREPRQCFFLSQRAVEA